MKRLVYILPVVALLLWIFWPSLKPTSGNSPAESTSSTPSDPSSAPRPASSSTRLPPLEVSHAADNLNAPTADIRADVRLVSEIIQTFRSNFPHDGNPVGNNAEITATLVGQNKFRIAFIAPDNHAINANGELCDRWGTPFFFHAESGTRMEIRSAGPDKKLYTTDDIVSSP